MLKKNNKKNQKNRWILFASVAEDAEGNGREHRDVGHVVAHPNRLLIVVSQLSHLYK